MINFFTKLGVVERVSSPYPYAKKMALKLWLTVPKIAKIGEFGINLFQRSISP